MSQREEEWDGAAVLASLAVLDEGLSLLGLKPPPRA
jgi:hypothetical protein